MHDTGGGRTVALVPDSEFLEAFSPYLDDFSTDLVTANVMIVSKARRLTYPSEPQNSAFVTVAGLSDSLPVSAQV